MSDVCADLIDELKLEPDVRDYVDTRLFAGKVPAGVETPFLWLQRRAIKQSEAMEVEAEPLKEFVTIECVSDDSAESIGLSYAVRAALDGKRGRLGDGVYSWIGVSDMREGYVPRNMDADEFLHISSLDVEAIRP